MAREPGTACQLNVSARPPPRVRFSTRQGHSVNGRRAAFTLLLLLVVAALVVARARQRSAQRRVIATELADAIDHDLGLLLRIRDERSLGALCAHYGGLLRVRRRCHENLTDYASRLSAAARQWRRAAVY